jgi:hypothetical protein
MKAYLLSIWVLLRRPTAFVPLAMSSAAVLTILVHIAGSGLAPQPDEGAAAHIWQLLMFFQLPVVVIFAINWLPQAPRPALVVLALQAVAIVAAAAPVALLHW